MRAPRSPSMIVTLGALAAALSPAGCASTAPARRPAAASAAPASAPAPRDSFSFGGAAADSVRLDLYVMSKCPYAADAEKGIKGAVDSLGERVDLRVDYIVSEQNAAVSSLHGEDEVRGDRLQLCARKQLGDARRWLEFVDCQNAAQPSLPAGWEACAEKAGLAPAALRSCAEGEAGRALLRESMHRSERANAQGSPTIVIAGKPYGGGRERIDFLRALCDAMKKKAPVCSTIPEDVLVEAVSLSDRRCAECKTDGLEANLRARFFPKLKVQHLDWSQPEGKKLYQMLGVRELPIWLFKPGVEKAERYATLQRWLVDRAGYKQLNIPGSFDPNAEICDNKIDDNGDGKLDCDDPTCRDQLACRKEIKRRLDVFIMSQCPFAAQALLASEEVMNNFKGKVTLDVHYVAEVNDAKVINSMHGPGEVAEDLRQVCARKLYPRRFLDYLRCRARSQAAGSWKACTTGGISARLLERCAEGERGKALLIEDLGLARALKISASPTWLANNRHTFSGISAEAIKNGLCAQNPGLEGCANKLSDQAPAGGGACGR